MPAPSSPSLHALLQRLAHAPELAQLAGELSALGDDPAALISLYRRALPRAERELWQADPETLALYQQSFRDLEALLARHGTAPRHRFIFVIPVADQPQHLRNILSSLLGLCHAYRYGGLQAGRFSKLDVLIADDSREAATIDHNRAIAKEFDQEGLTCHYFGAEEQAATLAALEAARRNALGGIIGDPIRDGFTHKGASLNRNLAYLAAARLCSADDKCLFYFVDSDEQFRVRVAAADGSRDLAALNYLYYLDRLFSQAPLQVLTGKVVGDPPVSPAVMSGNFLADVGAFVAQLAALDPKAPCSFHGAPPRAGHDAAYHDMADLFGFSAKREQFRYHCTFGGAHDHRACLGAFAARLDHFFHGEHPTRETLFEPGAGSLAVQPARTVYTGNYVCTREALRYFVPFAPLKLRMAGPTLGRILRAELGEAFVSANLPLLHTRTVDGAERFEFRPGIERAAERVDLSGEFERQFFGDVMLFSMEKLVEKGYPRQAVAEEEIEALLDEVEGKLREKYQAKRTLIAERLARARELFETPDSWWQQDAQLARARDEFQRFFANIEHNFGPQARGYRLIDEGEHATQRRAQIRAAIAHYSADHRAWAEALATGARA